MSKSRKQNRKVDERANLIGALIARDNDGAALTRSDGQRIKDLRIKIDGWHFARESLTEMEYEMSYTAEELLHTLDEIFGGYLN